MKYRLDPAERDGKFRGRWVFRPGEPVMAYDQELEQDVVENFPANHWNSIAELKCDYGYVSNHHGLPEYFPRCRTTRNYYRGTWAIRRPDRTTIRRAGFNG